MTALIPQNFGAVSKVFANQPIQDELSAGVQTGYGIISYRGKVWRTKYRGEERDLMRSDGDGPRASIEVVILKSSLSKSKIFYKDGYKEGSSESPDCFSANGVTPDLSAKAKQANSCDACPMNAWGSKVTAAGKPTKACSDSKRIAIVPVEDIENETLGGPMLLRVPAASLQDAAGFSQKMAALGYPLHSIAVRIAFDVKEAFPKFMFSAIRTLTDDEAQRVLTLRDDQRTARVLSEAVDMQEEAPAPVSIASVFEQPPQVAAPATPPHDPVTGEITQVAQPKRDYKKKPAPTPAPAPAPVEAAAPTSFDDELDAQLNSLLS